MGAENKNACQGKRESLSFYKVNTFAKYGQVTAQKGFKVTDEET